MFVLWFLCSWCHCGFGGVTGVPGNSWALGVVVLVVLEVLLVLVELWVLVGFWCCGFGGVTEVLGVSGVVDLCFYVMLV